MNYELAFVSNCINTGSLSLNISSGTEAKGNKKLICFERKMIITASRTAYYFVHRIMVLSVFIHSFINSCFNSNYLKTLPNVI